MNNPKSTISRMEAKQLAEMLAIFQKLPERERIAIQYYIKGQVDAAASNTMEMPLSTLAAAK